MLRTVEATFDPSTGVHFLEPVTIGKPVRILVTFMEAGGQTAVPFTQDKSATIGDWLKNTPSSIATRTPEEIDSYIQELRSSWD